MNSDSLSEAPNEFRCHSCGQRYKWTAEIGGRTLRCRKCEAKVRVPLLEDMTITAAESLEDTVADVEVEEQFDEIETGPDEPVEEEVDVSELRRATHRGMFGWSVGAETLFWGIGSVAGVGCAILALIVGKYFVPYIVAAVLIGPISWYKLWRIWPRWTQGRSFVESVADSLGADQSPHS